jgi:hypothetical protein
MSRKNETTEFALPIDSCAKLLGDTYGEEVITEVIALIHACHHDFRVRRFRDPLNANFHAGGWPKLAIHRGDFFITGFSRLAISCDDIRNAFIEIPKPDQFSYELTRSQARKLAILKNPLRSCYFRFAESTEVVEDSLAWALFHTVWHMSYCGFDEIMEELGKDLDYRCHIHEVK